MSVAFPMLGQVGRLGNQLWQLSSTIGLAVGRDEQPAFPEWAYMDYFSVPQEFFGWIPQGELPPGPGYTDAVTLVPHLDPRAATYLQDYGLFAHHLDLIRFFLEPSELAEKTLATNTEFRELPKPVLGVHVRRGDNAYDPETPNKHLWHPMPPASYYLQGIAELSGECASVAVFSDDPEWCRLNLLADYYHVGTPRPKEHQPEWHTAPVLDWIDLMLFAECDRHVISNSSYAWWGAFLSCDEAPLYPWPWYGPNVGYVDAGLMFPPSWRRIER